jgi:hypothetical protein
MTQLDRNLKELQEKFESMLLDVDQLMLPELKGRWEKLKNMIKTNASIRCTCEKCEGRPHGSMWLVKYSCPIHKDGGLEPSLCPLHMEDYTCAWSPGQVICGDTPCSNVGTESRGIKINRYRTPDHQGDRLGRENGLRIF